MFLCVNCATIRFIDAFVLKRNSNSIAAIYNKIIQGVYISTKSQDYSVMLLFLPTFLKKVKTIPQRNLWLNVEIFTILILLNILRKI